MISCFPTPKAPAKILNVSPSWLVIPSLPWRGMEYLFFGQLSSYPVNIVNPSPLTVHWHQVICTDKPPIRFGLGTDERWGYILHLQGNSIFCTNDRKYAVCWPNTSLFQVRFATETSKRSKRLLSHFVLIINNFVWYFEQISNWLKLNITVAT